MFFGSHKGPNEGYIYTIALTCGMHKVNLFEYLTDVINRTAEWQPNTPIEKYRELLPDRWEPTWMSCIVFFQSGLALLRHPYGTVHQNNVILQSKTCDSYQSCGLYNFWPNELATLYYLLFGTNGTQTRFCYPPYLSMYFLRLAFTV